MDIKTGCNELRADIKRIGGYTLELKERIMSTPTPTKPRQGEYVSDISPDFGEMLANVTLAYRHLEDAAMRLGKVIQAYEGGVSCYDQKPDEDKG